MSAPRPSIGPVKVCLGYHEKKKQTLGLLVRGGREIKSKDLTDCTRAAGTILEARPGQTRARRGELPAGFFHRHVRAAEALTCPVLQGTMSPAAIG